jgi:two-component system, NtrC family, sensor kinase
MNRPISLRTELLVAFAILAAASLAIAVAIALLFLGLVDSPHALWYLGGLILADVGVFVLLANFYLRRLVSRPLEEAVAAAEAIAAGDLSRRVPGAATRELTALADSFNRMTDALLEERAQVVHAEKLASVGRLAAGVAHEIGNPLGAINGYSHILRSKLGAAAQAARVTDAFDGLERESARIDRIVRGLLDYARPRRASRLTADAAVAARSCLELLKDQGVLRRMEVELDASDGAVVVADRFELEQVLVNLVLNAVDACKGSGRIALSVGSVSRHSLLGERPRRATDVGDHERQRRNRPRADRWLESVDCENILRIVVEDSGPGVPLTERDRIFDPFFTTKAPGQGTGLGLAIVARIVENLKGTVWVESGRDGGAAFHVLLPGSGESSSTATHNAQDSEDVRLPKTERHPVAET